ncbi:hypothetical protein [Salinibacter ruber]|uniref:hypothetical protein n=1 Tax=Salinibacter ruber TaxID=146919 RepID=UPI00216916A2|nr:hypothetical protein [Salinibacter ruber]MCS4056131.1 hypothetical protein [Salinibacter ruber]MCS4059952.1 hypothetical protein [Salinibacter ruber]MCS4161555.1 hypothetical protein [Salinibacter ruber]
MNKPPQADVHRSGETEANAHHVGREKKIGAPTIARLLNAARRIVEETVWGGGMVWYPAETHRRLSPSTLAGQVFPEFGTAAAGACARAIRGYTGKPFTEDEAQGWLAGKIGERLDRYVIRARSKINEIRLVVTESTIEVRAERPETTRKTVGPGPWATRI